MFLRDILNLLGSGQFKDDFLKWFPDTNIEKFEAARDPYNKDLQVLLRTKTVEFWLFVDGRALRLTYAEASLGSGAIGWKLIKVSAHELTGQCVLVRSLQRRMK